MGTPGRASGDASGHDHDLRAVVQSVLGARVELMPGSRGETFLVEDVLDRPAVLRLHLGDPDRALVDVAVGALLVGLVPVPGVLEWESIGSSGLGGFVLRERVDGEPLDAVLRRADDVLLARLGTSLGEVLARLSGVPFLRPGSLTGPDLRLEPWPADRLDVEAVVAAALERAPLDRWAPGERAGLRGAAAVGAFHLEEVRRTCLVHGDLDPAKVLVDPRTGDVRGVVGWHRVHAGSPLTDLGRVLRDDPPPAFVGSLLAAVRGSAPELPDDLWSAARGADLVALVETVAGAGDSGTAGPESARLRAAASAGRPPD